MAPGRSDTDLECSCLSGSVSGLNLYSAFARRPEHVGHPAAAAPCVWGALAHLGGYIPWRLKVQRVAGKGLGCFAAELIPRGAVVMEYIGEVITTLLAERRMAAGARRDGPARVRDHSDHFNLHFRKLGAPAGAGHAPPAVVFTAVIDPSRRGNVARVMNHSCDGGCLEVCEVNPCQRGLRALPSLSSPTLLRRVGSHGWAPPALDGFDLVGSRGPHAPTPADEDCPRLWEDLSASARLGLWMPRIAFVAKRDIYPGEELTYNYNMFRGEDEQDE